MIENSDHIYPIIVGSQISYLRLKNVSELSSLWVGDDSKVSLIYSLVDHLIRIRMLKYEHQNTRIPTLLSMVSVTLPNTGFCASNSLPLLVLDVDRSTKFIKLTGCTIQDFQEYGFYLFFPGTLEVAKFEGTNVQTVSRIRGHIKKTLSKPDEAYLKMKSGWSFLSHTPQKINKSKLNPLPLDIIFLRVWYYSNQLRKFYNPVTSFLFSNKSPWTGMRLTSQIWRD